MITLFITFRSTAHVTCSFSSCKNFSKCRKHSPKFRRPSPRRKRPSASYGAWSYTVAGSRSTPAVYNTCTAEAQSSLDQPPTHGKEVMLPRLLAYPGIAPSQAALIGAHQNISATLLGGLQAWGCLTLVRCSPDLATRRSQNASTASPVRRRGKQMLPAAGSYLHPLHQQRVYQAPLAELAKKQLCTSGIVNTSERWGPDLCRTTLSASYCHMRVVLRWI